MRLWAPSGSTVFIMWGDTECGFVLWLGRVMERMLLGFIYGVFGTRLLTDQQHSLKILSVKYGIVRAASCWFGGIST